MAVKIRRKKYVTYRAVRHGVFTQNLFRSPVKTILIFILIAVVTFGLFSQLAEYEASISSRRNLTNLYYGTGMVGEDDLEQPSMTPIVDYCIIFNDDRVDHTDMKSDFMSIAKKFKPKTLKQEEIEAIASLPYVSDIDMRYMTAGVSDEYYRLDEGRRVNNYSARLVIEGTLTEIDDKLPEGASGALNLVPVYAEVTNERYNSLILSDCKLLGGNSGDIEIDGETIAVVARAVEWGAATWQEVQLSGKYGNRVITTYFRNYKYTQSFQDTMQPGDRYVFVVRFDPLGVDSRYSYKESTLLLYDCLSENWCPSVWNVTGEAENYLETEKYAALKKCIDITNDDSHTFDIVYTNSTSYIKRFADGDMWIGEGRGITKEDTDNNAQVCVISDKFAKNNNLKVGDRLNLRLGDELFTQNYFTGAVAASEGRYAENWTEVTLEIVGIYANMSVSKRVDSPLLTYTDSTIFVPKSLIPVSQEKLDEHAITPAEFSFIVGNPSEISTFIESEKQEGNVESLGMGFFFNDGGWPAIESSFNTNVTVSAVRICAVAVATALALGFASYIFIVRKQKDFAIMRALGTEKKDAKRALKLPLTVLTAFGAVAGALIGWIYSSNTIELGEIVDGYAAKASIPYVTIAICILGEILFELLVSETMLSIIGRKSPLQLLQGNTGNTAKTKQTDDENNESKIMIIRGETAERTAGVRNSEEPGVKYRNNKFAFTVRYIFKHICRSKIKSILAIMLAALLLFAIGQYVLMQKSYIEMSKDTIITARFVDSINLMRMDTIVAKGYGKNPYYEAKIPVDVNYYNRINVILTNDYAKYSNDKLNISYADGYDETFLTQRGNHVFVSEDVLKNYGYALGEQVMLSPENLFIEKRQFIMGDVQGIQNLTMEEIQEEIERAVEEESTYYVIAGTFTLDNKEAGEIIFTPGSENSEDLIGIYTTLDKAELELADYTLAEEFKAYGKEITHGDISAFDMNTNKLDGIVKTSVLLEVLYPIVIIAALLIGAFLCSLVIIQNSKEAAIMRVLGTTKSGTRIIMLSEQIALSMVGLLLGTGVLRILKGTQLLEILQQVVVFTVLYIVIVALAAAVSAVLATRKNVLELLQTKE